MLALLTSTPSADHSSLQPPVHLVPGTAPPLSPSSRSPARTDAMSSMQELLHQPASWGEEWLKRLSCPSNPRELFQETSALEDVVAQLMKEQQHIEQQQPQEFTAPEQLPAPSQDRPVPSPPLHLASTPLATQPPQTQPSTSQPPSDSIDDIWSMLNKPAANSKPPLAPSSKAVVSHRSTQLESLYKLLQRFNSTAQGTGASEEAPTPPPSTGDNVNSLSNQQMRGITLRAEPDADGADNLASAFARTSSIEAHPQW